MQHLGDFRIDDYITFGVQLHRFSSGAVYAPTGNVTYTFYEDNSTTGAPTGGNLSQLNSKTGLYSARVQLTTANGFEAGKDYFVHVEATVDSVAAGELFMFRVIATPKVDLDTIKTQAVTCAAGVTVLAQVGAAGAPGAANGLVTTNGTKVNQTVDLTAGQSIACSDKTGFALSATGADLILKSSTFIQAIVAAINELATYGLTAINALLAHADYGLAKLVRSTTPANTLTVGSDHMADANVQKINDVTLVGDGSSTPWGPAS